MRSIDPGQAGPLLRGWLNADQPRLLAAWHVAMTGNGGCLADRWPNPRAALAVSSSNCALLGDPEAVDAEELRGHLGSFLEASEALWPLLRSLEPKAGAWARVNLVQAQSSPPPNTDAEVRPLKPADAYHVWSLSSESSWIASTWGGPPGLAASGMAYGAFVDGRLASLACTFFVAERFEDIGVITEHAFRGRGLSPACAAALCADIHARGRVPSWSTSPANTPSLRVAGKLGFSLHHHDRLWVLGREAPGPVALP